MSAQQARYMGTNDMGDGQASPTYGSAVIALPWIQSGK